MSNIIYEEDAPCPIPSCTGRLVVLEDFDDGTVVLICSECGMEVEAT